MLGSELIVEAFRKEGIDIIFGYPGAALIPVFDKLMDAKDIRFILPRHEQGGIHAAEGYARATGKTGVVFATSGPGATNLVTGIADANADSTPLVVFTGQVKRHLIGNDAFQEVDFTGITRPITKHNYLVTEAESLPGIIKEAFTIAGSGRPGPVVIDLPVDITTTEIKTAYPASIDIKSYKPTIAGNKRQIAKAATEINNAEHPVIFAGGGAIISNCAQEMAKLSKKGSIPVTTSMMGLGIIDENEPLSLGMLGMHGTAYANYAVTESDLLIAIGARFDDRVTGKISEFAPNAKIIHIDIDPTSISKNIKVDLPIIGDAKTILKQLLPLVSKKTRTDWEKNIAELKKDNQLSYAGDGLKPQHIIEQLGFKTRESNSIICTDVGQHQMWSALHFKFKSPRSWISSGGLGTMGYGLPAAIGAKLGKPESDVYLITGDGSFQMNIQELATVKNNKLPLKIILLNNSYLGMVRQWQDLFLNKRYANTDISDNPDFIKIIEGYGIKAKQITKSSQVNKALDELIKSKEAMVLDCRIEREENVYPMVPAGEAINRMIGGMA
ncbi:MAG: biosynthetic-type acetolactate synthase large subunit [Planctomycetota bacterium]|jgi:acetolactate synthase-1/2/3 large subunit